MDTIMKKSFFYSLGKNIMAVLMTGFCILGLASCKVKISKISKLNGMWQIKDFSGFNIDEMPEVVLEVSAKDKNEFLVTGFSGVNHFFAVVNANDKFPLGERLASTKMMGAPEDMRFEDSLLTLLASSDSWVIKRNLLTVSKGDMKAHFIRK